MNVRTSNQARVGSNVIQCSNDFLSAKFNARRCVGLNVNDDGLRQCCNREEQHAQDGCWGGEKKSY